MTTNDGKAYIKWAWGLILGFTAFRLIYAGYFPLVADETNYWQWGRHLAWGYHDNAPMIGWAIRLATVFLGNTATAVRLPSVLSMAVASAYMVMIAARWISPKTAFYTALLSQGILEFNVGGLLATTDGLQAAGWAGACYHLARAYEENKWGQWLLTGLYFGFGILSKYTMVLFLPGAYIFGLVSKDHRKRLAGIRPYAGLLVGFLMFCPVIIWNSQNDWNSVRHVAYIGGANQGFTLHLRYMGEFLGAQAGLLSPLVFILVLMAWHLAFHLKDQHWIKLYLFYTSFPVFLFFSLLSLHTRVYGNWPGTAYLTASVLTAAYFSGKKKAEAGRIINSGRRLWPWAVGTSYLLTAILLVHVLWPILPISNDMDRVARETAGWHELGQKAGKMMATMPRPDKTFLFGLKYQIASELAFYTPGQPETVGINKWNRPNVYDYWWKDKDLLGWDAVGVTRNPHDDKNTLNKIFNRVGPPVKFKGYRSSNHKGEPNQVLYLYRAYGFKGGLRWVPPDKSDIRAD